MSAADPEDRTANPDLGKTAEEVGADPTIAGLTLGFGAAAFLALATFVFTQNIHPDPTDTSPRIILCILLWIAGVIGATSAGKRPEYDFLTEHTADGITRRIKSGPTLLVASTVWFTVSAAVCISWFLSTRQPAGTYYVWASLMFFVSMVITLSAAHYGGHVRTKLGLRSNKEEIRDNIFADPSVLTIGLYSGIMIFAMYYTFPLMWHAFGRNGGAGALNSSSMWILLWGGLGATVLSIIGGAVTLLSKTINDDTNASVLVSGYGRLHTGGSGPNAATAIFVGITTRLISGAPYLLGLCAGASMILGVDLKNDAAGIDYTGWLFPAVLVGFGFIVAILGGFIVVKYAKNINAPMWKTVMAMNFHHALVFLVAVGAMVLPFALLYGNNATLYTAGLITVTIGIGLLLIAIGWAAFRAAGEQSSSIAETITLECLAASGVFMAGAAPLATFFGIGSGNEAWAVTVWISGLLPVVALIIAFISYMSMTEDRPGGLFRVPTDASTGVLQYVAIGTAISFTAEFLHILLHGRQTWYFWVMAGGFDFMLTVASLTVLFYVRGKLDSKNKLDIAFAVAGFILMALKYVLFTVLWTARLGTHTGQRNIMWFVFATVCITELLRRVITKSMPDAAIRKMRATQATEPVPTQIRFMGAIVSVMYAGQLGLLVAGHIIVLEFTVSILVLSGVAIIAFFVWFTSDMGTMLAMVEVESMDHVGDTATTESMLAGDDSLEDLIKMK